MSGAGASSQQSRQLGRNDGKEVGNQGQIGTCRNGLESTWCLTSFKTLTLMTGMTYRKRFASPCGAQPSAGPGNQELKWAGLAGVEGCTVHLYAVPCHPGEPAGQRQGG